MPTFNQVIVVDNLLQDPIATEVSKELFADNRWAGGWASEGKSNNPADWHWHRSIWNDRSNMPEIDVEQQQKDWPMMFELWKHVFTAMKNRTGYDFRPIRCYANLHTYGVDGYTHTDDGDMTAIYYPCAWNPTWEGGTALYNADHDCIKYCSYKRDRLFIFPANTLHRAMPVTKDCSARRVVVVFKTVFDIDSANNARHYYSDALNKRENNL